MRRGRLIFGTISALFSAAPSHAEPAGRLFYDAGSSAPSCPDEAGLRAAVRARLGEDPFATTEVAPKRTFLLGIEARGDLLIGSVELRGGDGRSEGRRVVTAKADACEELVGAMALAVSLAINPDLAIETPPAAPPSAPPPEEIRAPEPEPPPLATPPPPRPGFSAGSAFRPPTSLADDGKPRDIAQPGDPESEESRRLAVLAGAFAHGTLGAGPGPGVGGSILIRLRSAKPDSAPGRGLRLGWSFGVEGRFDALSQDRIETGGSVHSTLFAGVFTPCVHLNFVFGCPTLLAGSLSAGSEDVPRPDSDRGAYYAAGVRLGAEHTVAEHVRLEARFDAVSPLAPVRIVFDQRTVWDAGTAFALGAGAVTEFP